jgi:hypothetical protein
LAVESLEKETNNKREKSAVIDDKKEELCISFRFTSLSPSGTTCSKGEEDKKKRKMWCFEF